MVFARVVINYSIRNKKDLIAIHRKGTNHEILINSEFLFKHVILILSLQFSCIHLYLLWTKDVEINMRYRLFYSIFIKSFNNFIITITRH